MMFDTDDEPRVDGRELITPPTEPGSDHWLSDEARERIAEVVRNWVDDRRGGNNEGMTESPTIPPDPDRPDASPQDDDDRRDQDERDRPREDDDAGGDDDAAKDHDA